MSYDYSSYYASAPPAGDHAPAPYASQYGAPAPTYGAPSYPPSYAAPSYAAPAPYGGPPPAAGPAAGLDEVRTIFITGFPADVKERELNNMLRFLPGYEASQMNWKNGQAQGFALFQTGGHARAACDAITQLVFDEGAVLRCEMARKNMYIKEDMSMKRPRTGPGHFSGGSSYPPPGGSAPYRPPAAFGGPGGPRNEGDNPPCNTLFIGNLSEHVNEQELTNLFNKKGFRQLKVVRGRNTTAFVEFDTVENAIGAHDGLQGSTVSSNGDRGGIRIQYSRNPFGKKRDVTGTLIDTPVRNPDYVAPGALQSAPAPVGGAPSGGASGYEPMPYDPQAAGEGAPGM